MNAGNAALKVKKSTTGLGKPSIEKDPEKTYQINFTVGIVIIISTGL